MDYLPVASLVVFLATIFLMIKRPRGINLGVAAGIGAIASLLLGTVSIGDAIVALGNIWDAALAFVGIVTLSVTLDTMGFFRWAALRIAGFAHGSGVRLYFYTALLTAAVSILFANDSAVLILTPIVMEMVRNLKMTKSSRVAYLFGAGLIADTAAMPLITSNPVNIVSADYFGYTFIEHMVFMVPIAVATVLLSMLVVYLFFRRDIPKAYSTELVQILVKNEHSPMWLKTSMATLVAIDAGYVVASFNRIPVSFVICAGALFLLLLYAGTYRREAVYREERVGAMHVLRKVNWDILFFMISIFLVVQGLSHAGAVSFFSTLFVNSLSLPSVLSTLVPSLIVTVSASAMNNWPMTFMGLLSIKQSMMTYGLSPQSSTTLIFSNIIGNNLGPHFFPLGSLAILMWLGTMKRKGLTISFKDYLKVGSILSVLEVTVAAVILWIEQTFLGFTLSV
ncbi:MAG: ArsB/NhaD family transporter [Promethearchaeati archaeon SRVP18_Atabeyarchaeia-1]